MVGGCWGVIVKGSASEKDCPTFELVQDGHCLTCLGAGGICSNVCLPRVLFKNTWTRAW